MKRDREPLPVPNAFLSQHLSRRSFTQAVGHFGMGLVAANTFGSLSGTSARAADFKGPRPYKIGFVAPLTGPVAPEGIAMQHGFDLGIETINAAGGIAGHRVDVVSQDTQAVPAVAATVVKKFIQEQQVDMIIGTITNDEEVVASQLCAAAGVPVLFPEHGFWHSFCNSTTVMMGENSFDLNGPLVPFVAEKFGKNFFLIGSDFSYPHAYLTVAKSYMKQAGVTVLDEIYAPLGTADWSSSIAKIKSAKPDVIYSCGWHDAILFIKQMKYWTALRQQSRRYCGRSSIRRWATRSDLCDQFVCVRYSEDIETAANNKFIANFKKKYGNDPIPLVATTAYISLDFAKAAVEKAGTYDKKAVFNAFKEALKPRPSFPTSRFASIQPR
ncbi:MAG: ABC transporter substrate-binding protein [Xanthobacteraceae bacterium]